MSTNNEQASNITVLCKEGCGFFGSESTGGCCSKCWMGKIKKQTPVAAADDVVNSEERATTPFTEKTESKDICPKNLTTVAAKMTTTRQTDEFTSVVHNATTASITAVASPLKKTKKKKKTGYKNMMASVMSGNEKKDDTEEKEALLKVCGGGTFSKIDKI
mmetsp:Transcript_7014/g.7732  ORF Transcript_7014/g.7732 Transcript_7014/m.7732 type:complete len:161 (+) Transcript_7014:31-513(+)|eukprot:CAMPEP_0170788586 /NCGR_PEP_ID=MMETSP0733-20121128/19057_1 /TAXON_ID=186038 /ORGANISM="Fragilariopsis kerguelensis, Strain L26-C5" /LENGTH=160 /DNA_ID=CAMNT_0011135193 /DNA_START=21 /DNA_END=503 /DNA_ORIENTATION=+